MAKNYAEGNVVKSYKIGNTRIKICDDYCRDKTPEEVDAILKRIADFAYECLLSAEVAKRRAEKTDSP